MTTVNIAVVGVGNCVSSLVQGVEHHRDGDAPGLANPVEALTGSGVHLTEGHPAPRATHWTPSRPWTGANAGSLSRSRAR